jgi:hypothetical protein
MTMVKAPSNSGRTLNQIAGDIHRHERASIFEIGALLIEAEEACDHGQWYAWLKREFDWSLSTAANYMWAAKLAAKSPTVRDLNVPARIIYRLAHYLTDPKLPAMLTALEAAMKETGRINVGKAENVINLVLLRATFGDYPEATLKPLNYFTEHTRAWSPEVIEALKEAAPDTKEAAQAIIGPIIGKYEAKFEAERAARVAAAKPAAGNEPPAKVVPSPAEPPAVDEEAREDREHLERQCQAATRERHQHEDEVAAARRAAAAAPDDLAEKLRAAEIKIVGLESEIEDLKAENAALRRKLEVMEPAAG